MTARLQASDTASLCCARQLRIRPPPSRTPGHKFCASAWHAARTSLRSADGADEGWSAVADSVAAVANKPNSIAARFISELLSLFVERTSWRTSVQAGVGLM